jgi:hypothetical protein|tara:strand:- start:396 stop:575 length:180 start_codon:yes stop_codon:yes gene_type:complete
VEVFIYSADGKFVHTESKTTREGVNEIPISLNLNAGVFFISMKVEGQVIYEGKRVLINN